MPEEIEYDFGHSIGENSLGWEKRALMLLCITRAFLLLLKTTCPFRPKGRRVGD